MSTIRIRQIAQVGSDYAGIEQQLHDVFGLDVSYRDPGDRPPSEAGVSPFGLRNFIMPIGDQFLETVAPKPDVADSAGARYIERRGGDGGYMVIMQVPSAEFASRRQRLLDDGVRLVSDHGIDDLDHAGMQLHPKDCPGGIQELRCNLEEDRDDGAWWPTGPNWQAHKRTDIVRAIRGAEFQTPDPADWAARWSQILDQPVGADAAGNPAIELQNATVRFVRPTDGRPPGLAGIDLEAVDGDRALANADRIGVRSGDDTIMICGLRLRLV
ncbi:MAG: Glyoxalase-like domain-containing protein [Chloroflexi bacterium]|nr:MAG: Glyoxalase-like domain-containing protein [Chloroflexota bacterium]